MSRPVSAHGACAPGRDQGSVVSRYPDRGGFRIATAERRERIAPHASPHRPRAVSRASATARSWAEPADSEPLLMMIAKLPPLRSRGKVAFEVGERRPPPHWCRKRRPARRPVLLTPGIVGRSREAERRVRPGREDASVVSRNPRSLEASGRSWEGAGGSSDRWAVSTGKLAWVGSLLSGPARVVAPRPLWVAERAERSPYGEPYAVRTVARVNRRNTLSPTTPS